MTEQDIPMNQSVAADVTDEDIEISMIDVLTQLAYRKWLIAKVTGAATLIGLILCFALPVKYVASTKLMTPQQSLPATALLSQLSASGTGSLAALAGGGLSALKDPNAIYLGLLASRPVEDAIIHQFSLDTAYRAKDMTEARKKLAENTAISSEKVAGFIDLSVTDNDKKRVAQIANAYTDELRKLMKSMAVTEASQRRVFYEEQLNQAQETLVTAELGFLQVQQKKGLVEPDAQAKAMIESITALRAKVDAQEVRVQALRSYTTEQNPELQLAERELASLQGEVAQMAQRSHSAGFSDLGLADVPGAGMDYLRAEHELKYRQALFDLLLKQYDAAKLDEAREGAIIQVVEPAIEPEKRASPKRAILLLTCTAVGFVAACFLALLLWIRERSMSDPEAWRKWHKLSGALSGNPVE